MARKELGDCIFCFGIKNYLSLLWNVKVARYSFSDFEYKLRRKNKDLEILPQLFWGPLRVYPYARV